MASVSDGTSYRLWTSEDGRDWRPVTTPSTPSTAGEHSMSVSASGSSVLLLADDGETGRVWLAKLGDDRPDPVSSAGSAFEDEGDRAVVDGLDAHVGTEDSALDAGAEAFELRAEGGVEGLADRSWCGCEPRGRRPLRVSPYNVNWEMTRIGAPVSEADCSSRSTAGPRSCGPGRRSRRARRHGSRPGRRAVPGSGENRQLSRQRTRLPEELAERRHASGISPIQQAFSRRAPARRRRGSPR